MYLYSLTSLLSLSCWHTFKYFIYFIWTKSNVSLQLYCQYLADTLLNVVLKLSMTVLAWCSVSKVFVQQKSRWVTCMKITAIVDKSSVSKTVRLMLAQECVCVCMPERAWIIHHCWQLRILTGGARKTKAGLGLFLIGFLLTIPAVFLQLLSLVFYLCLGQCAKTRHNKSPAYAPTGSKLDVNYHELGLFCIHQPLNANVVVSQFNKLFTFLLVLFVYVVLGDWNVFPRNAIIVCHCYKQIYVQSYRYFPLLKAMSSGTCV